GVLPSAARRLQQSMAAMVVAIAVRAEYALPAYVCLAGALRTGTEPGSCFDPAGGAGTRQRARGCAEPFELRKDIQLHRNQNGGNGALILKLRRQKRRNQYYSSAERGDAG